MKKAIESSKAPAAIGAYSQAIEAGGILFVSGQLPINREDGSIPSDAASQTHQSMQNIAHILTEAGLSFNDVVRCGIFVKNMDDFAAINEAYGSYLEVPYPARATVEVARLPKDVLVEIDAIAVKK